MASPNVEGLPGVFVDLEGGGFFVPFDDYKRIGEHFGNITPYGIAIIYLLDKEARGAT